MANSITLAQQYVAVLDQIYKETSLTAVLDGAEELVREGANVNELVIPKLAMDGLADYSRNSGYVAGDVSLTWETVACNFDRGRMFQIDALDDEESRGIAYGRLAGEFIRTKVVPEEDAFRIACYAGATGIGSASGTLSTGDAVISALRVASNTMDDAEVSKDSRVLFIVPTLKGLVDDLDTTKSKAVLERFSNVIEVPQSRMYTLIDQYDGTSSGETAGGYVKDANGKDINFLIVEKSAAIQFTKHVAPKIIDPDSNQTADAWKYGYRKVGIADVYENKVAGIYCHHKA